MLIGVLSLISIFAAVTAAVVILGKRNIFESAAVGLSFLLCLHVFISYILFIFDCYTIVRTVSTMFVVSALTLSAVLLFKKGRKFDCDTGIKNALIPIIICAFLVPFVSIKNGYYGMGQDEGGYQTQAFFYMNGDTKAVHDFPFYYNLSEEDKEAAKTSLNNTNGMDSLQDGYYDSNYYEGISPSQRYIHGIPSFSALMATWGSIFGADNIQGVQTLIYVLLIFLVYFVTERLKFTKVNSAIACFVTGFYPGIIWVMKSALTESFMAILIILFLWLLVNDSKWSNILSIVPVMIYGMYHVSFYTIIPLFIGVYAFRYLITAEKKYIGLMYAMPALQIISFFTMCKIQPIYTRNNYMRLFVINRGNTVGDLNGQVILVALIYMLVVTLFSIFSGKFVRKDNRLEILSGNKIFLWGLRLMLILPIAKVFYSILAARPSGFKEFALLFMKTTFYHFAIAAGLLLAVTAVVLVLIKPAVMLRDNNSASLSIMFFYCILVYSAFLNKSAYPVMYYTRYLVPFISVAAVFVMYAINLHKKLKAYITLPVCALCMCMFVPTNMSLLTSRDDTKLPWEVFNSITELIGDNDAVIVAENTRLVMWMGIESRTNADVYPQYKDILEEVSDIEAGYDDIFVIKRYPMYEQDTGFELVYTNTYDYQDECTWDPFILTLYPTDFASRDETIYVYRKSGEDRREYPIIDFYGDYTGLAGYETSYAWTGSEVVELHCDLADRDYNMIVDLMPGIPFGAAENERIDIDVYINDEYLDSVTLAPGVNEEGFTVFIDDELFDAGSNTIRFESNLWSASINNPADTRELGFAIESIVFEG